MPDNLLTDYSYRAKGKYDATLKNINLDIYVLPDTKYVTTSVYNITKKNSKKTYNAFVMFFTKDGDNGTLVGCNTPNLSATFNPYTIKGANSTDNVLFDPALKEFLMFVFHDNAYSPDDLKNFFANLENYYDDVVAAPDNFMLMDVAEVNNTTSRPRKLGASLIKL